ncbi:hypothetical protein A9Y87_05315 [Salmonella enterica subsp. enterica]|nr:hypothetical protein A9Y87_05315 [Salmonella enterica subsp. enterica]
MPELTQGYGLGGFKKAWTNNPAWLFRELARNTRFGLAKRAGYIDIDDGALYVLSQYCDQLVNDGYGGQEPRMTLNAYITEQVSARDIIDKIASMFSRYSTVGRDATVCHAGCATGPDCDNHEC